MDRSFACRTEIGALRAMREAVASDSRIRSRKQKYFIHKSPIAGLR